MNKLGNFLYQNFKMVLLGSELGTSTETSAGPTSSSKISFKDNYNYVILYLYSIGDYI